MNPQIRVFSTLWAAASLFHFDNSPPLNPASFSLIGVAGLTLWRANQRWLLVLAASSTIFIVSQELPAASNHAVVALLVNLAILMRAVAGTVVHQATAHDEGQAPVPAGPVLGTLLVVYGFTVFHKLNSGFFDPRESCATVIAFSGLRLHGLHSGTWLSPVVPWMPALTVVWELAILLLLAKSSLRRWGVLTGFVFHLGLGLAHFYDFSTLVFAIYLLVLPPEIAARANPSERARRLSLVFVGGWAAASVASWTSESAVGPLGIQWFTLQTAAWLGAMAALLAPLFRTAVAGCWLPDCRRPASPLLWVIPALALLNGLTPYLGLKTVANFSMFSNLRVEAGASNHFLVPAESLELTPWVRDPVDVLEVYLPGANVRQAGQSTRYPVVRQTRWLREPMPIRIPWLELRRAVVYWHALHAGPIALGAADRARQPVAAMRPGHPPAEAGRVEPGV